MKSKNTQTVFQLSKSGIWRTAVTGAVLSLAASVAMAQSSTVGTVFGKVTAGAGDSVTVTNSATGLKRTVGVDSSGAFRVSSLPPGHYVATLLKANKEESSVELDLLAGQGAEATFLASKGTTELEKVVVTGRAKSIDVSSTTNGSVFSAKQLDAIPVANRNINGIVALAQNTVKADSRYDGGVSIGGGGPSENAYYINGFAVTNPLTQLGSMELPYGAIQQAQIQTGGFGAEYGRSVGGVVNITTKSGTNQWKGGAAVAWTPNALRGDQKSTYYAKTGAPGNAATDGTIYLYNKDNKSDEIIYSLFGGGPIIKDKLFVFLAADLTDLDNEQVNSTPQGSGLGSTGFRDSGNQNIRYLGKIDYNITNNHRLEATLIGDNYKTTDDYYGYDYGTHSRTAYSYTEKSKNYGGTTTGVGGDAQVIKYSGNITDNLLVTALYGESQYKHEDGFNFSTTSSLIQYNATTRALDPRIAGSSFANYPKPANLLPAGTSVIGDDAEDTTKSLRFDVEYKLFSHLLRAGVDDNKLKSKNAGEQFASPVYYRYARTSRGTVVPSGQPGGTTLIQAGAQPDANGFYYYVTGNVFNDLTNAESNQSAQYVEDRWNITKDVLFTYGLRREGFENLNGDGETFLKVKDFYSPRLAASWDVNGDASLKIFGSAGRYSLQIPTHVAVRGASRSTNTVEGFLYTGVNPATAEPTGLTSTGDPYSANNEYGQAKDPKSVASQDIVPTYQDEVTLGFEKTLLPNLNGGLKMTFRKLEASIDDFCDFRPIDAYAAANNIDLSQANFYPFGCATLNTGERARFYLDPDGNDDDGNGVDEKPAEFNLTAKEIGLPEVKRTYLAFDLFLEHPLKNKWYGKVSYTWSRSKGNTEGQTRSDTAQTDVAVTQTADFPELSENIFGRLPNDRTHSIKAYGYYLITPEVSAGAAVFVESGRPKNCIGNYPTDGSAPGEDLGYGSAFQYCSFDGGATSIATPRGSQGRLPWNYSMDLNAVYKPMYVRGLSLRADVFNLLNKQTISTIDEVHEARLDSSVVLPTYGRVISYTAPRSVRLTVGYEF